MWVEIAEQSNNKHSTASHAHSCITFCVNARMDCILRSEFTYLFLITNNKNSLNRVRRRIPADKISQMLIDTGQFVERRQIAVAITAKTNNTVETIHFPEYLLSVDLNGAYAACNGRSIKSFVAVTPPKAWTQFVEPKKNYSQNGTNISFSFYTRTAFMNLRVFTIAAFV